MDGLALYEMLEKKIEELIGQARHYQESYRRLEDQLQEKENNEALKYNQCYHNSNANQDKW